MSMPVITLSSPSKKAISYPPEITKTIKEASFSSYLDGAEESFALKLGGDRIFPGKNRTDDREIDIFDAEKYFNEAVTRSPKARPKNLYKKDDSPETFAIKKQTTIAAPSIRSDSSWNSRSALLHNVPRNQQMKKAYKNRFLASIGCNCSCADKNSIDIDESIGENSSNKSINTKSKSDKTSDHLVKKPQSDYRPELSHFSFPITKNQAAKMHFQEKNDTANRKSLEMFNSPILENSKKLTLMTWDGIASGENKIPSISNEMLNDSDSDASSDLFEIESISKDNPFLSRQASDGQSACYAPSEVSIEWSVVTASAADFSVLSDSEELNTATTKPCLKKVSLSSKIGPKLRPSILSGCKSQKAVRVAGDAHVPNESHARMHLGVESFTRFHDESKLSGFEVKNKFDQRVLSQTRPASAAHLLYT